ncbi:MAG TPA: TetR family transcriptional regulator [Actinospica sp.]|nr:TetR family transcriptional regulator [Actinospica sp.]HWG28770.1 TetR family transcriptional regulator [Actinospica sp.]
MGTRGRQAVGTKEAIMATAERLFAEHGVTAVSSRQISEAAGQGNNAAVGYHFGAKADLIRAIVHRHDTEIEQSRNLLAERVGEDDGVRAWVECLVRPLTEHLAAIGRTSWYGRFSLQVSTDPALRDIATDEVLTAPSLGPILRGLHAGMSGLSEDVRRERLQMVRSLIMHTCADRERALAGSGEPPAPAWARTATLLVDAVTGLLLAPDTAESGS